MDQWNHILDGGHDRANLFAAATAGNTAMQPFAKLLWTRDIIGSKSLL